MTRETDRVWTDVIAAEDEHGEGAEDFARREAAKAEASGGAGREQNWQTVADELNTLHAINRRWARPRGDAPPSGRR